MLMRLLHNFLQPLLNLVADAFNPQLGHILSAMLIEIVGDIIDTSLNIIQRKSGITYFAAQKGLDAELKA
ncbi:hypothetical protein [Pseudomonas sp. EMN2]|uniref:hypothetical protein n=1 Tax=Pseudomonas sp. EMN2 TaxID=2615212 RepID=UPI00129A325D|nr:hypothetical protein [Pseudomonas sp. EMN2]